MSDTASSSVEEFLHSKLNERSEKGNKRSLGKDNLEYDFLSNDYLGLARNEELFHIIQQRIQKEGFRTNGSGGSRLLSGNHVFTETLEASLAQIFNADAALIFNSGYNANLSLISSVAQAGDTILYDSLAHVCLKEGAWLSRATAQKFRHNDLDDLTEKLSTAQGNKFIVTESVFSMDGDVAPLEDIISLAKETDAKLIVDEAHSTGCYGSSGNGWLCVHGWENEIFARVYTFGKGMGSHGAVVCGSQLLIDYLINFGRSFIYTTALPLHSIIAIEESFHYLSTHPELQKILQQRIDFFLGLWGSAKNKIPEGSLSKTAIQPIIIPGNKKIKKICQKLNELGFDIRPILAPTVPEGLERIRLSLHVHNSEDEIESLVNQLIKAI